MDEFPQDGLIQFSRLWHVCVEPAADPVCRDGVPSLHDGRFLQLNHIPQPDQTANSLQSIGIRSHTLAIHYTDY